MWFKGKYWSLQHVIQQGYHPSFLGLHDNDPFFPKREEDIHSSITFSNLLLLIKGPDV